jgi:hypothetical protein
MKTRKVITARAQSETETAARVKRRQHITIERDITIERAIGLTSRGQVGFGKARKLLMKPSLELTTPWLSGDTCVKRVATGSGNQMSKLYESVRCRKHKQS